MVNQQCQGVGAVQQGVVKRAVELSAEKYCSASIMLGKTAKITHDYEIQDVASGD